MDSDDFFSPYVSEFEKIDNGFFEMQNGLLNRDFDSDFSSQNRDHESPPIFEAPHSQSPSSVADPITVSFPAPGVNLSFSSTLYPQNTFPSYTDAAQTIEAVSASFDQLGQQNFSLQAPNRLETFFSHSPTPIRPAAPKQGRRSTGSRQSPEGDYLFKILNDIYQRTLTHNDLLALMMGLHKIYSSFPRPSRDCCRAKVTLLTFYAPYQSFIVEALRSGVVPIS